MTKFEITWLDDRSDEAILAEIRRVAALMPNHRLTIELFNAHSRIKSTAVRERFGSWTEATKRAGLDCVRPDYADAAIIEDLRRVSALFPDVALTASFYSSQGRYSSSCIKRRFGGWRSALCEAGIPNRYVGPATTERMKSQPGRALSNDDILCQIRNIAIALGKTTLSGADIVANSRINFGLLWSRFGSVSEALRQAGIEQVSHGRRHTEEQIFENLLRVWTHYGRPPTALEMDRSPSTVGKNAYIHRYGGWRKALRAFVERANSEANGRSEPDHSVQTHTTQDGQANPMNSAPPDAASTSKTRIERSARSPRATIRTQTYIRPEDRRDPGIGLRFRVLQRGLFRCQLCGRSPANDPTCELHVDHVIPFSKGGKTVFENLQALCSHCNVGKSNRSLQDKDHA